MIWKNLYGQSSRDHGTLMFFRNRLNRIAVTKDPKKEVDATIDFLYTVLKGHWLACACNILGISTLDEPIKVPNGLYKATQSEQQCFVENIACEVVKKLTLIDSAFDPGISSDTTDSSYNYARVLCHYGSLVMEFRDAWSEGDGERVVRCWRLFMPHFQVAGCRKYCLQAFRLQLQINVILSPNLAHQVMWHRFVNSKGGQGRNIPCDLYNEHVNKLIKLIIQNMGSNLTDASLKRSARSVSTLQSICETFDNETGIPYGTYAHSTKSDTQDVKKVLEVVLQSNLLTPIDGRKHSCFPNMRLDPLHKWNVKMCKDWIEDKKTEYLKYKGAFRGEGDQSDSEASD